MRPSLLRLWCRTASRSDNCSLLRKNHRRPLEIGYRSWWYNGIVSPTLLFLSPSFWWNWRSGGHRSTCGIGSFGSDMFPFSAASRHGKLGAARYFQIFWAGRFMPVTTHHCVKHDEEWSCWLLVTIFHNSFMCAVQETILEPHFARHAQCFVISCLTVIHVATGLTLLAHQITIYLLLGIGSGIFLCCSNYCYYYYILILLVKKVRQIGSRLWISQGHVRKPTDHVKSPNFFGFRFHRILTGLSKLRWLNRRFLHQLTIIQLGVIMVVACRLTPFKTLWSLVPISRRPLRK